MNETVSTAAPAPAAKQPLFGRMRYDRDVETLAGAARTPPIFRPIEMTMVSDSVSSFHDVAVCLKQTANVCTRLANQSHLVKNSFCLRTALVQHVFTRGTCSKGSLFCCLGRVFSDLNVLYCTLYLNCLLTSFIIDASSFFPFLFLFFFSSY